MKRLICAAAMAVGLMAAFAADDPSDGWAAKFYKGLEAAGDVTFEPQGYYGKRNAIVLKWSDGMPKFGAAKRYVRVKGSADWTVTAQASVDEGGKAGAAIEFFDKEGRSLALLEGATPPANEGRKGRTLRVTRAPTPAEGRQLFLHHRLPPPQKPE